MMFLRKLSLLFLTFSVSSNAALRSRILPKIVPASDAVSAIKAEPKSKQVLQSNIGLGAAAAGMAAAFCSVIGIGHYAKQAREAQHLMHNDIHCAIESGNIENVKRILAKSHQAVYEKIETESQVDWPATNAKYGVKSTQDLPRYHEHVYTKGRHAGFDWVEKYQAKSSSQHPQARIYQFSYQETSTLLHAVATGNIELVKLFIEFFTEQHKSKHSFCDPLTPCLALAARLGYLDIMDLLIKNGANVNGKLFSTDNVLKNAIAGKQLASVTKLIECGADLHNYPHNGPRDSSSFGDLDQSYIDYAVRVHFFELIPELLKHGLKFQGREFANLIYSFDTIDLRAKGELAITSEHMTLFKQLVDLGASVQENFQMALELYAENGPIIYHSNVLNSQTLKCFVEYGADINVKTTFAHSYALSYKQGNVRRLFSGQHYTILELAIIKLDAALVCKILENKKFIVKFEDYIKSLNSKIAEFESYDTSTTCTTLKRIVYILECIHTNKNPNGNKPDLRDSDIDAIFQARNAS